MKPAETTATICGVLAGMALVARGLRARRSIDFRDRVAVITGGSRGLGLLLARELGREGARLILVTERAAVDNNELPSHATDSM
jgi:hypothetical protein